MFFYFSFLRPPPSQVSPSGGMSITPQIANDLRTEPFDGEQDVFFSWALSAGSTSPGRSLQPTRTKPTKLTTWRQATAYKEIRVPMPPNVKDGQAWRLILSTGSRSRGEELIDLSAGEEEMGREPLPVMSVPILFSARAGRGVEKQERIERVYRLGSVPSGEEGQAARSLSMKLTELTSYDLDKKIWDSGIGLSSWMVGFFKDKNSPSLDTRLQHVAQAILSDEPRRIVELGAGMGIVALTLAALRSNFRSSSSGVGVTGVEEIFTTDVESAMPLLEENITSSKHLFSSSRPKAAVLDWDEELPEYITAQDQGGVDAIVMADVSYNTDSFPSLVRTLAALIAVNGSVNPARKAPVILMGYKVRDPGERTLWDIAREAGIEFEKVAERRGAGGAPVEIWIGHAV